MAKSSSRQSAKRFGSAPRRKENKLFNPTNLEPEISYHHVSTHHEKTRSRINSLGGFLRREVYHPCRGKQKARTNPRTARGRTGSLPGQHRSHCASQGQDQGQGRQGS